MSGPCALLRQFGAEPLFPDPALKERSRLLIRNLKGNHSAGCHGLSVSGLHDLIGAAEGTFRGDLQGVVNRLCPAGLTDHRLFAHAPVLVLLKFRFRKGKLAGRLLLFDLLSSSPDFLW